ncbi:MAG: HAMP domain-containing histidine kinase [Treponema sp.]|nr:HAMP domain-containing histidine kinase [Treponema sp.]
MAKIKGKRIDKKERWALTFLLAGIMAATSILFLIILYFMMKGIFKINILAMYNRSNLNTKTLISLTIFIIFFLSYILSFGVSKLITIPINRVMYCMNQLGLGNYKVRLHPKGPLKNISSVDDFTTSFNKMASELEHTDTLSNDFINNFSHEFKTPIVSIAGFAKLLKKGKLDEEQQKEYLTIIEEESVRLSNLAVGVMNMMKIENQEMLSNIKRFNLSEQIRNCILLLEAKWTRKNLNLDPDFDEYYLWASEELLKHVWINLLDNAIKFSPEGESIIINIEKKEKRLIVSITNTGVEIPEEVIPHIFNKFYQSDESHSSEGYGIGLAVVRKVAELHHGSVNVTTGKGKTTFTVILPM